jgi:hypothetical protein
VVAAGVNFKNFLNMKTFQIKFKTLLFFLLVGLAFASCRNGDEGDKTDSDSNSQQVDNPPVTDNDDDATSPASNRSQDNNSRIAEEEGNVTSPDSPEGNKAPIALDCNYFRENPNTVLKDNPEANVDYIISCATRIDGKLTIEPGVVIAFEQDAGMHFTDKSAFKMEGSAENPIILTGKEQTKGFWAGIFTTSTNTNNRMSYVTVDYAGGNSVSSDIKAALGIKGSSSLTLNHCTFSNSKNIGMEVYGRVEKNEQNVFMKNCTFTKNNIPFKTDATHLRLFNDTNIFSGNDLDYIYLNGGTLLGDATWANLDVPYFLQDNFKSSEGVLTVEPGTEIIMPAQSWMHLSKKASLIMVGTAEDPIIIRGEHDVAGFWLQLNIDSSSPLNEIGHVIFKNAGNTTGKPNGAVFLGRSKFLNIHDVVFSNCFEYGISLNYGSNPFHLEHADLKLDNTPKLFSNWKGEEVADPDNT